MAHRNSPQTYFMCRSKNFRRVHMRVCVWMGEVVHQAKQTVEEMMWGGILSPQLILLRGPMIYSKKTNYWTMISKVPELQTFPSNLRFSGGGEQGGGGVRTLSIDNLKFNGKNWGSGILANHNFFAHPPGPACLFTYKHTDSRVNWVHLRKHLEDFGRGNTSEHLWETIYILD